jgi:hypothetical protein
MTKSNEDDCEKSAPDLPRVILICCIPRFACSNVSISELTCKHCVKIPTCIFVDREEEGGHFARLDIGSPVQIHPNSS